ncbi:uncharacterized protein [Takifugu rubripes]|uniref:uncharacterized protein n=1 Tax=Takifugu rubripes TaxID=31033 RepID=UPI001145AE25|nr:uncharacterized protein LOC115252476 [Takifugu rubripes]
MENFIRINVWLGILCLCFPANPFPLHLEDSNIDVIREDVKCVRTRFEILHSSKREGKNSQNSNPKKKNIKLTFMVQLSCQPQGSLVQEMSSRVSMFHPVSLSCFMSASRRLKPFSHLQDDHHCIIVALECVAAELKTVRRECEDPEDVIGVAEEFLTHTIQKLKNGVKIEVSVPDGPRGELHRAPELTALPLPQKSNSNRCAAPARAGLRSLSPTFWTHGILATASPVWGDSIGRGQLRTRRREPERQRTPENARERQRASESAQLFCTSPHQRRRECI